MKAFKYALAASVAATILAAVPAYAQFTERNIRLSNGVNEDHPNGKGVEKFQACLTDKSGGSKLSFSIRVNPSAPSRRITLKPPASIRATAGASFVPRNAHSTNKSPSTTARAGAPFVKCAEK